VRTCAFEEAAARPSCRAEADDDLAFHGCMGLGRP
jgi:hypothetical protein